MLPKNYPPDKQPAPAKLGWFLGWRHSNQVPQSPPPKTQDLPAISGIGQSAAVAALEEAGFWILRQATHIVMTDGSRILTIPAQDPINGFTMEGLVLAAGLTVEQFRELL